MKAIRLSIATALALVALGGLALALTRAEPGVIMAEDEVGGLSVGEPARIADPPQARQRLNVSADTLEGWYFKPGYEDYAPRGVPDFDQRQDQWGYNDATGIWHWTHCGPVAAANSVWWFDSKFEPRPDGPSGPPPSTIPISDHYPLVTSYGPVPMDDHDPGNVVPFVDDLAWYVDTNRMRTGSGISGTNVYSLAAGLEQYIDDRGLADRYYVSMRGGSLEGQGLDMHWVYQEVMKSEDVILLLGFYQQMGPGLPWARIGGHYVTVVGVSQTVDHVGPAIGVALSDPMRDWAELGWPGRVLSGTLVTHYPPHPGVVTSTIHNDAGNVSHDIYWARLELDDPSPGGPWYLEGYELTPEDAINFQGVNSHPLIPAAPYEPGPPIHTEIEYAVAVSPMFWKAAYDDYAPSGIPDFDMRQDLWGYTETDGITWQWTHDGPAAWANSFWWFDAKFSGEVTRSEIVTYSHVLSSVPQLVEGLAGYAGTNRGITGTSPISLSFGIDRYLADRGLENAFYRTTRAQPPFTWVAKEVEKSEDVLLLIGFWQRDVSGAWQRLGGHWVTVAGINERDHTIAFSDPYRDWAEEPFGQGRVLPSVDHPFHDAPYTLHNDARYVSHDVWVVTATESPGGLWGPVGYGRPSLRLRLGPDSPSPAQRFDVSNFFGLNPHPGWDFGEDSGYPVVAEVEYAVAVSPMEMFWKGDEGYDDYAPSGVPDFDQKQTWFWQAATQGYCGPVAAANSFWWFDSKFEPNPVGPTGGPPASIPISDHFPLVHSYGQWDDHDPSNVGGTGFFGLVDDLAALMDTNGQSSAPGSHLGTRAIDMVWGINEYLKLQGMADQFYTKTRQAPAFEWVCDQVEQSEDVVLLVGFWEYVDTGQGVFEWVRHGGHYVTVAGVDRQFRHIAFSDPFLDAAENAPPAPMWSGRVLSGTLVTHYPPHPGVTDPTIHNDAGNISHDIYQVTQTVSPGGIWGPVGYAGPIWPYFREQNQSIPAWPGEEGELGVVVAEVEFAFVVSPLPPDVTVRKAVTPTHVVPGAWVTFTIAYTNVAAQWAENVVISDMIPSGLFSPSWDYATTFGKPITGSDTYTWSVGTLGYLEGGVITVTARVDPTITDPQRVISNRVAIKTTTPEREHDRPNRDAAVLTVQTSDVTVSKSVAPSVLMAGDWLTYTIVFTNSGPAVAGNAVVTDLLHTWLVSDSYDVSTSYGGMLSAPTGRYVWSMGDVPPGGRGTITVTARISPTLSVGGALPNTVSISTDTPESDISNNEGAAAAFVIVHGVAVSPHAAGDRGDPGDTITYTLLVTNTGNTADTIDLTHAKPTGWTVTYSPTSALGLGAGLGTGVDVVVGIPSDAPGGSTGLITITARSQGDGTKYDQAILTTEVNWLVYLPMVVRNL